MYQENLRISKSKDRINIVCILLIIFAIFVSRDETLNRIALYAALPLSFILSFFADGNSFRINKYLKLVLSLYLWLFFTIITSLNIDTSMNYISQMLGCVILCYTISNLAQNKKVLPWLYVTYSFLLVEAIIYAQNNFLALNFDISSGRVDSAKLNANTLSYYVFYATISLYIVRDFFSAKKFKKLFDILFIAMIPVSFFVAIIAASRQVLVIQIPTIVLLLWIRYFKEAKLIKSIIAIIFIIVAFVLFKGPVTHIYDNSYLSTRNKTAYEEDIRVVLIKEAYKIGCENPVFGLGPGGFALQQSDHLFSHCTYTELFANSGFFALAIYVYLLLHFVFTQYKRYRYFKDNRYLFFLTFGCAFMVYQFFFVFTSDLWLISFFVLVATHSELYYSQTHKRAILNKRVFYK